MYGDRTDDYYYMDEGGNLIEPSVSTDPQRIPFPVDGEDQQRSGNVSRGPSRGIRTGPQGPAPPAVSEDFLDRALGNDGADEPPPNTPPVIRVQRGAGAN